MTWPRHRKRLFHPGRPDRGSNRDVYMLRLRLDYFELAHRTAKREFLPVWRVLNAECAVAAPLTLPMRILQHQRRPIKWRACSASVRIREIVAAVAVVVSTSTTDVCCWAAAPKAFPLDCILPMFFAEIESRRECYTAWTSRAFAGSGDGSVCCELSLTITQPPPKHFDTFAATIEAQNLHRILCSQSGAQGATCSRRCLRTNQRKLSIRDNSARGILPTSLPRSDIRRNRRHVCSSGCRRCISCFLGGLQCTQAGRQTAQGSQFRNSHCVHGFLQRKKGC